MTIGDYIICKKNKKFTVIKELGSGGQGSVWLVKDEDTDENFAFKIIFDKNPDRLRKRAQNIRNLYEKSKLLQNQLSSKNFSIALPLHIYTNGAEFGYVMNLCKGKSINTMMLEKQFEKMPLKKRLTIVRKIAETAHWIRQNGLCYQDFSHKNFMYDDSDNGWVSVIDCDNIAPTSLSSTGEASFAGGTGFYTAPEIAFGQCKPSIESDAFALSTLIYKIMTGSTDSPYHGKEFYTLPSRPESMFDAAFFTNDDPAVGTDWMTFVFDDTNPVNKIEPTLYKKPEFRERQKMVIKNWEQIPETMKELFRRAFLKPLDPAARKKRPSALEWMNAAQGDPVPPKKKQAADENKNENKNEKKNPEPAKKTAGQNKPRLFFKPAQFTLELSDSITVIDAQTSNQSIQRKMGTVKKEADGYYFCSESPYMIKYYNMNGASGALTKNTSVKLEEGTELYWAMRPNETVKVLLS